ncbi:MAG: hypothetical protein GC152_05600 [Alphaproteobacteria bacterium]|nr:hypothetical protein [Alphaproteobacteria bacterium]
MIRASIIAAASSLALASTAFAETVEKTYDFTGFSEVSFKGVFDVEISVGADFAVSASGEADDLDRVTVDVEDGVLSFDQGRKQERGDREAVDIVISMPALAGLDVSGVAEVNAEGVDSEAVKLRLSGVGNVSLAGSCGSLDARVSGVGELDAEDLECASVDVQVSGVGEAVVFASKSVDAKVSGIGEITVYGSPDEVTKSSGLFGSVTVK